MKFSYEIKSDKVILCKEGVYISIPLKELNNFIHFLQDISEVINESKSS